MLLVMSAPSVYDPYYAVAFHAIVDFQINFANAVMGNDNILIIADADTKQYYERKLPEDILLTDEVYDIWVRDFATVNPKNPIQFRYTCASMTQAESQEVQNSFNTFAAANGIVFNTSSYLLDGGNIVDNYYGKIITTTRFMSDNNLTKAEAKSQLQTLLNAAQIAIIEPDESVLAHADGMVMWLDENTLLVNDYSSDSAFRTAVLAELQTSFHGTTIIEVPVVFANNGWPGFESACGVSVNAAVTYKNIYVPDFNMPHSQNAINLIKQNTTKNVITINAEGVCPMGGSVRCLTWQIEGDNASKLIENARVK